MSDLTHLFAIGQKLLADFDGKLFPATVKETYTDHIIVDVVGISDHCWYEHGFNLDTLYPDYNLR